MFDERDGGQKKNTVRTSAGEICDGLPDRSISKGDSVDLDEVGNSFRWEIGMDTEIKLHPDFSKIRLLDQFAIFSKSDFKLHSPQHGIVLMGTADGLDIDGDFVSRFELFCRLDLGQEEMRPLKQ